MLKTCRNKISPLLSTLLLTASFATTATAPAWAQNVIQNEAPQDALEEFEDMTDQYRQFREAVNLGLIAVPLKTQQNDSAAHEVRIQENPMDYSSAIMDPFYGYQTFILVDKSVSSKSSKNRHGNIRTPQTMYIYQRNGEQLHLVETLPVSTGKEPAPNSYDTREGFMRVQSAQATYISKKYGEAMPNSLWFESEYGTAIHQTTKARCDGKIGLRASAGCIRLCEGDSQRVFDLVTKSKYTRDSAIVLLDKRSGRPVAQGLQSAIKGRVDENGAYTEAPKVIRGYPVFVRIIDGKNAEKIEEIESLIQNPTEAFKSYFPAFSPQILKSNSI
jgi:lipoprotein-anchoring transpeptidase ErfK/SrfK